MLDTSHRFHGLGSLNFAYKKGQTLRGPLCSLKFVRNPQRSTYRVAVIVSRKVSKSAVVRNRIRRRMFAVIADVLPADTDAYDMLFTVFSDQAATLPVSELEQQVRSLFAKASLIH
ncbi:MAG TPA: ribonuclease P protein component [Candidatus Saccharimonadales bacterium]|nr:ribonuclease P protein component [Candidatus Saccharimonadales bacterium]